MMTASRSCRDALLMALNTRLQVDYLLSNMTGYEMLHSCTIHVSPGILILLLLMSSADGGEPDFKEGPV